MTVPTRRDSEEAAEARTEALRRAILAAVEERGGQEHRMAIGKLLGDLDDSVRDEEHHKFTRRMRSLGFFLRGYGARELWTAIWLRFAVNVFLPEGWAIGPHGSGLYEPGDEWRFVDRMPPEEYATREGFRS